MTSTAHSIAFLIWPETRPMTLALAEEALRVAQRVHPEVSYELRFLQAEAPTAGAWQLPGFAMPRRSEAVSPLFDAARYARNLEAAWRGMWADWCARQH